MPSKKDKFLYYKKQGKETPFETIIRYSDQKEESSKLLANILKNILDERKIKFLDIGTGNGQYLRMTLARLKRKTKIDFTLLEPSKDLLGELKKSIKFFPKNSKIKITTKNWRNFQSKEKFDIILASHLFYHVPKEEYRSQLSKMIEYLKEDGFLIIVLREKDDIYRFKKKFKPFFFGRDYEVVILEKVLKSLNRKDKLEIKIYHSNAKLVIPMKDNLRNAIGIIEFYLSKKWNEIPEDIKKEVLSFVQKKQGIFYQKDGIALIKKILNKS